MNHCTLKHYLSGADILYNGGLSETTTVLGQCLHLVWTSFRLLLSLQSSFNFFVCFTNG